MFKLFKKNKLKYQTQDRETQDFTNIEIIAQYFQKETGVAFQKQISILNNKVMLFCQQHSINSYTKLLQLLQNNTGLRQKLTNLLTTNESYFYREFQQIQELVDIAKIKKEKFTILCAPCATGEEPYTIAIALLEAGVLRKNFSIMGIDINEEALQKAQEAIYTKRNISYIPQSVLGKYFRQKGSSYILKENIKNQVKFKLINIFDKEFLELRRFDFIFSRNMLIYFDEETKQKAKKILENMCKDRNYTIFFGHADLF